ncbi:LacI family transcriptional regulator [bacterium]|nr:MAG: LacI family transcriptional regulator [bacterium]
MRATIRSIAEEAGVSNVTVSNVLRGLAGQASEETRVRVLEVAKRQNYIPVRPPTSQNSRVETGVVTVVPERQEVGFSDLDLATFQGIVEGARKHGFNLFTLVNQNAGKDGARQKFHFLDRSTDGFIFIASMQDQWVRVLDMLAEHKVPSVVCYRRNVPEGVAWASVDNEGIMREAVAHLVKRGHSRIAFIAGPPNNFDAIERLSGWKKAMLANGLDAGEHRIVAAMDDGHVPRQAAIDSVSSLDVTAAVCFDDSTAFMVWSSLEKQEIRVPDDISLVGVNNHFLAKVNGLTSVSFTFADVGRLAVEAWVELYNGGDAATCCKIAPLHLVSRNTVRDLNDNSV